MRKINAKKFGALAVVLFGIVFITLTTRADEFLPVLKVGDDVYKNVTITSVTATDVYFTSGGIVGNAKLRKLDPALQKHFHFDPVKMAALEKKQRDASIPYSVLAARALKDKIDRSNAKRDLDIAIGRVKEIVNQPVRQVPETSDLNAGYWPNGWFHQGAMVPDFKNVDIRTTQEVGQYARNAYITSNLNPGVAFPGADVEFNGNTKFFYVDRSLPKKRLTQEEMLEINSLYRLIARCEDVTGEKLVRLPP